MSRLLHHEQLSKKLQMNSLALQKCGLLKKGDWKIKKIHPLGDRHFNGEAVSLVTITNHHKDDKIIYKPHSLEIDRAFSHLIDWINKKTRMNYITINCWSTSLYGWAEYISFKGCCSRAEVKSYYRRLGGLLAVCHFLFGIDIHHDNIIAHGEYPVVVDHETFLTPVLGNGHSNSKKQNLVIYTAILPRWRQSGVNKRWLDKSAFSGYWRTQNIKKDHLPSLNGSKINPYEYQTEFLEGFKNIFYVFIENKDELLGENSPLNHFKNAKSRVILRDTSYYYRCLKDSAKNISRKFHGSELSKLEIAALKKNDIPYFMTKTNGNKIIDAYGNNAAIHVYMNGYSRVRSGIRQNTSQEELVMQIQLVKQSFLAGIRNYKLSDDYIFCRKKTNFDQINHYIKNRVQTLNDACVKGVSEMYWTTIIRNNDIWLPTKTSINFKHGNLGILMVLSYMYKYSKLSVSRDLIYRGLKSFREIVQKFNRSIVPNLGMIGEALYALYYLKKNIGASSIARDIKNLLEIANEYLSKSKDIKTTNEVALYLIGLLVAKDAVPQSYWRAHANSCITILLKKNPNPSSRTSCCLQSFLKTVCAFVHYGELFTEPRVIEWLYKAFSFIKSNLFNLLNQFGCLALFLNLSLRPLSKKIFHELGFPKMEKWLTEKLVFKTLSKSKFFEGAELWVALSKVAWHPLIKKRSLLNAWFAERYSNNDICPELIDGSAGFVYQLLHLLKPNEIPSILMIL